jgi:hypothetical protein
VKSGTLQAPQMALPATSPFQQKKDTLKAVTFLNYNCISPESSGRQLIEDIEFSFLLEQAYPCRRGGRPLSYSRTLPSLPPAGGSTPSPAGVRPGAPSAL